MYILSKSKIDVRAIIDSPDRGGLTAQLQFVCMPTCIARGLGDQLFPMYVEMTIVHVHDTEWSR